MSRFRLLLFLVIILLLSLTIPLPSPHTTQASSPLVPLTQDIPQTLPAQTQLLGQANAQQTLALSIVLSLHQQTQLQHYLTGLYTPGSYLYHRYLSPTAFAAQYGPTVADVQNVGSYLRAQGLHITHIAAGRQSIDFSATVMQVERTFHVQIENYRDQQGRTFYANTTAPLVPQTLRPLIVQFSGLSNVLQRAHPQITTLSPIATVARTSCPGSGGSSAHYYTPTQLATGYNLAPLYATGYRGEGQNAALFELDGSVPGDISSYQACFAAGSPTHIVTQLTDGGPGQPGNGGLEVTLDMEILLGMLPHLANLYVYEAPNTDTGYNDQWIQVLNDDIPVVSSAWGLCEADLSPSDINAEQQFFLQAAAQGQSILAASGDNGAYDCGTSSLAVDDPASNPYVTGVGGTSLSLNNAGAYVSEQGWSGTPTGSDGSGGGISQLWSMPTYQHGPGVLSSASSGTPCQAATGNYCREVPDVALNANPDAGYPVYCTISAAGCLPATPFISVGGTSAATVMWAALVVLANQYLLAHGGNNLGFLNPTLYTLLNSNSYHQAFHDITGGSNLYYSASNGYDMVTGMGSYNAQGFVTAVATLATARAVPGSTRWYFAEGHLGNGFQEYVTLENPDTIHSAHVSVHYLLRGQNGTAQNLTLDPGTRTTINVNLVLHVDRLSHTGLDVSLIINSDIPIVAERPLYFTFGGNVPGGSDLVGSTQLSEHFTFANSETLSGYATFLTLLNPPGQHNATVTISCENSGRILRQVTVNAPTGQRSTISLNAAFGGGVQCLLQVDATQPITIERPLYFRTSVPGIGLARGGSSVPGVTPTTNWYFPDGSTGDNSTNAQENLILANPDSNNSGTAANVTIHYTLASGKALTTTLSIPARSQIVESVNHAVGNGNPLVAAQLSVSNGIGIVVERQQFFAAPMLVSTPSGTEVVGMAGNIQSLPDTYSFAEGHVGSSFSEYVTILNPNNSAIQVAVTYFLHNGIGQGVVQQQETIPAQGVIRLNVNAFLNVLASDTTASGLATDDALVVQSLPDSNNHLWPIVAERSLYFTFVGSQPGETSVLGFGA